MNKVSLAINKSDINNWARTLGMQYYLNSLINSELFDISYHEEILETMRGYRATILYLNGKKIYLDFWEYPTPTCSNDVYNAKFDLIIKLQHREMTEAYIHATSQSKGFLKEKTNDERIDFFNRVRPFSFFPSRMFMPYVGKEDELKCDKIERMGFFCGKAWRCRGGWKETLEKQGMEYLLSDQGERNGVTLTDKDYLYKMQTSKYGIILHGRGSCWTDCKNRREIDYMMLRKPLLLNYAPFYFNPLIEGVHYIPINHGTDFKKIDSMYNIEEIVKNAFQWYKENATPEGIATTFLKIAESKKLL